MKLMGKGIGMICFCMLLFSCTHTKQTEIDKLEKQVLAIHDEAMPRIGEVLGMRKKINLKLDSCTDENQRKILQRASYFLTKADADMMQWMHSYSKPERMDTALTYLKGQLVAIEKVKVQIFESIVQADSLLKLP